MASEPVNVSEFSELARQVLPKMVYGFYAGGAEDEWTLKQNIAAFQRIRLVVPTPGNLEGLISVDVNTEKGSGLSSYASQTLDSSFTWKDIKWLQSITNLPILMKGILTAEDAELAIQAGAAGIVVSNHGARQLDFSPASITVIEEVVNAVRGRVPVLLDGGIRRGTDVFKALALGAQAVLVGRPIIFGLAVKGQSGVKKVLDMLHDELELAMSLSGCCSVKDITRSHVQTEHEMMRSLL